MIQRQAYRPAFWRVASAETNYRRFFDINALAGLRVEEKAVFDATHKLIFELVDQGRIHGLRIDHIDGLADPAAYLKSLRSRVGPDVYIVVEKILEADEALRHGRSPEPPVTRRCDIWMASSSRATPRMRSTTCMKPLLKAGLI